MEYPGRLKSLPSELRPQLEFYRYGPVKVSAAIDENNNITIFLELLNPYVHTNHIYFTVSLDLLELLVTTNMAFIRADNYTIFNIPEGLELAGKGSYVRYTRFVSDGILEKLARVLDDYKRGNLDDLKEYPNVP